MKICKMRCESSHELSVGDIELSCFIENGWENKTVAECIEKTSDSSTKKIEFSPNKGRKSDQSDVSGKPDFSDKFSHTRMKFDIY